MKRVHTSHWTKHEVLQSLATMENFLRFTSGIVHSFFIEKVKRGHKVQKLQTPIFFNLFCKVGVPHHTHNNQFMVVPKSARRAILQN